MLKENVLKIEFIELWNQMYACKIIYQNENVFPRGTFADTKLGVYSRKVIDLTCNTAIYLLGENRELDGKICIVDKNQKEFLEKIEKKINEKYGIPQRWKPKENEGYFYLNSSLEIEYDLWVCGSLDEGRYKAGNCFLNKEQAKLASKILKESLIKFNSLNISGL